MVVLKLLSHSVLKICGVSEEDVGSYTCTASTRDFGSLKTTPIPLNVGPGVCCVFVNNEREKVTL